MSAAGMPAPPAFLGGLWDVQPMRERHAFVAGIELPLRDYDRLWQAFGRPASLAVDPDVAMPTVLLLACRAPRPPEPDALVMAEAALALLEQLVSTGTVPLTVTLARCFDALFQTVNETPLAPAEGA